jgi:putative hydrolase
MYCFADYHTHTQHSHGTGTVAENVAAAAQLGLEVIAISDHGPNHLLHYGMASLDVLKTIRAELTEACVSFPEIIGLVGIEANIISVRGDLDLPLEDWHLVDLVLANIHTMVKPASFKDATKIWGSHFGKKMFPPVGKRSRLINTEATINALMRNKIDILTHPGVRFSIDYRVVAQACAAMGTAFELNASKPYLTPEIVELVAKEGATFVIGSDAHSPQRVGDFALGLELAKQVGLTPKEVVNAKFGVV